jgi:hypothetical protein
MASLLVLEDGSGVENANSYTDAATARVYAATRGITLPAVSEDGVDPVEVWLVLAAEYLDAQAWIGYLATPTQGLQWPRVLTHPYLNFKYLPYLVLPFMYPIDPSFYILPPKLIAAQCQLCIEQSNGITLMPSTEGGYASQFITREKTDVIETNYSEKLGTLTSPTMPIVLSILRGLLVPGGGSTAISAVRM